MRLLGLRCGSPARRVGSWCRLSAPAWIVIGLTLAVGTAGAADRKVIPDNVTRRIVGDLVNASVRSVAVVDFVCQPAKADCAGTSWANEFSAAMVNEIKRRDVALRVYDRTDLAQIMKEHKITAAGLVDPSTTRKLGQIVGVEALVTGSITKADGLERVTMRAIETETAEVLAGAAFDMRLDAAVDTLRFRAAVGYSQLSLRPNLPRNLEFHSNHPDDVFLVGDPGRTHLDRLSLDALEVEAGLALRLGGSSVAVVAAYVARVPLQVSGRTERQQVNDPRPVATGTFVYTQVTGAGTSQSLRLGAELDLALARRKDIWLEVEGVVDVGHVSMTFEKGWSRFGQDQTALRSQASGVLVAPRAQVVLRAGTWAVYVSAGAPSIRFSHTAPDLESHTGHGYEITFGTRVSFGVGKTGR